jgi:hypothetical protein
MSTGAMPNTVKSFSLRIRRTGMPMPGLIAPYQGCAERFSVLAIGTRLGLQVIDYSEQT